MEATFVKDLSGFNGTAKLWKLSESVKYPDCYGSDCYYCTEDEHNETEYVITSATVAMFSGPETYIFPSNESGEVVDWMEMEGSYKGGLSHQDAIDGLVA